MKNPKKVNDKLSLCFSNADSEDDVDETPETDSGNQQNSVTEEATLDQEGDCYQVNQKINYCNTLMIQYLFH